MARVFGSGDEEDGKGEARSLTLSVLLHEVSQHAEQMLMRQKSAGGGKKLELQKATIKI